MKKWSFAVLVVVGATIIGPLAANGNVAVHEQGTAKVDAATSQAQHEFHHTLTSGGNNANCFTVPAGKLVVIQEVSGLLDVDHGANGIWKLSNLTAHEFFFGADGRISTSDGDELAFSEPTTIYFAAGELPVCGDVFAPTGGRPWEISVSGYMVDAA